MARTARRGKRRGGAGRLLGWLIRGFFLFIILSVLWVLLYSVVPPPITFTMVGDLASGRSISRDWMPLARIDDDMVGAAIAAEDSKFCSHNGFDRDAIAAAMRDNARGGRIRGGSTISQQTAKNAFLWQGGGWFRKGLEAWFTLLVETFWSKQRIMEVYLNVAETGIGTYGVNAGALRYFDKDASSLTRGEAARIAAVLPLPKEREAIAPTGFTRRYGNSIAARIRVVQRDGLDSCVRGTGTIEREAAPEVEPRPRAAPAEKAEDYRDAPDAGPPLAAGEPSEAPGLEAPTEAGPVTTTEPPAGETPLPPAPEPPPAQAPVPEPDA